MQSRAEQEQRSKFLDDRRTTTPAPEMRRIRHTLLLDIVLLDTVWTTTEVMIQQSSGRGCLHFIDCRLVVDYCIHGCKCSRPEFPLPSLSHWRLTDPVPWAHHGHVPRTRAPTLAQHV